MRGRMNVRGKRSWDRWERSAGPQGSTSSRPPSGPKYPRRLGASEVVIVPDRQDHKPVDITSRDARGALRATQNAILYVLAHAAARRLLAYSVDSPATPYETARRDLALDPETFNRLTRKLAQFDLIRLRPAKPGEFENGRIKLVVAPSPRTEAFVRGLGRLDKVLWSNRADFTERDVAALQGSE